jgi:hypothetical protein
MKVHGLVVDGGVAVGVGVRVGVFVDVGVCVGVAVDGALIVNVCAFDVPPPGVGLNTVTFAVPAVAMSAAVIAAVNCVALTNVVVRSEPFHRTTDPLTKFVPFTVSGNAKPPAVAEDGLMLVVVGTGLLNGDAAAARNPG